MGGKLRFAGKAQGIRIAKQRDAKANVNIVPLSPFADGKTAEKIRQRENQVP